MAAHAPSNEPEQRVLLLAPTRRDQEVTQALLTQAGIPCEPCADLEELRRKTMEGTGAILTTWEALAGGGIGRLLEALEAQPPWSDLPVILLLKGGEQPPAARQLIAALRNVTLLERPAPTRSVVSAVQAAIRGRVRQYQLRDQIRALQREQARSQQLREELTLAVDASELGTFHCAMPPKDIVWNERCKALFWLPPEAEIDFDLFYAIIHPDDRERTRQAVTACIEERQPYRVIYRTVSPAGETRYVLATGRTYYDEAGRPLRFDGTAQDVTERELAETSLRGSEARFRQLADAMPQIVWTARPDGVLDYVNRRWYEYIQRTEAEFPPADWHVRVHPDDLPGAVAVWTAAVESGLPYATEFRVRGSDETYRWFLVRALAIHGEDGAITHWYGTCTDIHDQRALLEQNSRLLESERAARAEAERVSQMKDEFLATLSHELRTPLNAILGWTQVLRGDPGNVEDVEAGLVTIERNARAQTQIIEDLLDMSKIIAGKVRLDVQPLKLDEVVAAAVETMRPAATAKNIRLQALIDPQARMISGDQNRLQQVFWNLLSNAIKFTPKGGRVQIILERIESHLEVRVADTGEGIAAEFVPYVFDRFRQQDASTTRRHGGLGLGLAIVKQLVELHGGSIGVESAGVGQGTTFSVKLPLSAVQPVPVPADPQRRHPQSEIADLSVPSELLDLAGVKVLVVDDELDARTLVKRLLEDRKATVRTASSAEEALAILRVDRPDVLVSDIGMPQEDGYSLMRRVRALEPQEGGLTPAVALTAYARAEDRLKAMFAGFQVHVSKPVNTVELLALVANLAGRTGSF